MRQWHGACERAEAGGPKKREVRPMQLAIHSRYRRWLEVLLGYFRPHAVPFLGPAGTSDSLVPWALWGLVGAMSGVLALSGLVVAFFLLYSPLYLLARSWMLVGKGGWVDRRELRFYLACFILLFFLGSLAVWQPVAAASL